jgi:cobalt/nickel transport system ATP-binding protein
LNKRNEEGMTIIMSTHDLNLVAAFADRVYVLAKEHGVITAGTPYEIFMQVEALKASNIDAPLLTELFIKLRSHGIAVDVPVHIDQAVTALVRLIK